MKKIIGLLLVAVMCFSLIAGCDGKAISSQTGSSTADKTLPEGSADPLGKDFSGYPIANGGKLSIWANELSYHSAYISEEESPYHQWLSEFTGVTIEWHRPSAGETEQQAYTLMIASNELPDIIYRANLLGDCETLLADDYIIPLENYMETYAPSLYSYLKANPAVMTAIKSDSGHLYNFPFLREDVAWLGSFLGIVVNSDYLKQAGCEMPVTIADWEAMVYKLKEVCDIVIAPYQKSGLKGMFANAFGIGSDNYYVDGTKVKASYSGDGYKKYLTLMNKWYADGIIDPDFVTMDMTGFTANIVAKKIATSYIGTGTPSRFYDALVQRDGAFKYVAVPYPVVNKGDSILYSQGEALFRGSGAVITTACKNIELACRFLDYGYTEEGITTWNFGKEGESFEYVDGKPKFTALVTEAEEGVTAALKRYTCMTSNGPSIMLVDFNRQKNLDLANDYVDVWTANCDEAALHRMPPVCARDDERTEVADLKTAIETYVNEMYINFIIGSENLDKYDEYTANLESMGLSRLLEIMQNQVDRYNAR
jgi:putative aldouronate transport system substrate-binding protein